MVYWSGTFNFLQEVFLFIQNLFIWYKRPIFRPVLTFITPSSVSWLISSCLFEVRYVWFFLSVEQEIIVGISAGLREEGGPRRRREIGEKLDGIEVRTLTTLIDFCLFTQSCPTLCNPIDCSMPGFPVLHHLSEFAQTHVLWVGNAIHPSCSLLSPSSPTFNLSQHQGLF